MNVKKYGIILSFIIIALIFIFPFCEAKTTTTQPTTVSSVSTTKSKQPVEKKKTAAEIRKELNIPMKKVKTTDKTKLQKLMKECKTQKAKLKKSYPSKNSINYEQYKKIIDKELINIDNIYKGYNNQYKEIIHFEKCTKAYPTATKIWKYLRKCGYNNYVCAGILGNMMAECGGQTFNLKATIYDSSRQYYGICQWSKRYCPAVYGTSLDTQLSYLKKTMPAEFNNYGGRYARGFNYKSFCALKNEKSAALAFAKCYEKCGSSYYSVRQTNAIKAYKYFAY